MNDKNGQTGHMISAPASNDMKKKEDDAKSDSENWCSCGKYIEDSTLIGCEECNNFYHLDCVGLGGLIKEGQKSIERYVCPFCVVTAAILPPPEDHTMAKNVYNMLAHVVANAVKEAISETDLCRKSEVEAIVKEENTKAIKSYSDATASSQKKVLNEMSVVQSSKTVVEKVTQKLDNDKVEREKRKLNVCIMGIKESCKDTAKLRNNEDYSFCVEKLGINEEDISSCFRAGAKNSDPSYCRPLIVKMVNQRAADYWTDDGRGWRTEYKTDNGKFVYINPDLCKADRSAHFLAREERRKRRDQSQQSPRGRQPSEVPM